MKNTMMETVGAVILAAGKGSRLKSTTQNKVTIPLGGKPMIQWSVEKVRIAGVSEVVVVVGFARESVQAALGDTVTYTVEEEQLGTGHASWVGVQALSASITEVFILYGDHSAFYPPAFYEKLLKTHRERKNAMTLVSIEHDDPSSLAWGRIIRNAEDDVVAIVEEKEATEEQKKIRELNAGLYVFDRSVIEDGYATLKPQSGGEYYLTDLVVYCLSKNKRVGAVVAKETEVGIGVNTPDQKDSAAALFEQLSQ
ncbi:NTP transferase domain-containing protein [Candidatus Woesebacteria bacterium]|nr:NTP transferase domain-containing protein [Candidatus Woesebacteria bacterium]